ncbi:MAG TPA: hypothetical protein VIM86_07620 [Thermodesulfobacteriota bacterium]
MGLLEDVAGGPIALDTAVFVYFIEEDPGYLPASSRSSLPSTPAAQAT